MARGQLKSDDVVSNAEILKQLGEYFSQFVLNGLILGDPSSPENVITGGTVSLINTGNRDLIVTCAHVYDYFYEMRAGNPHVLFALAGGRGNNPVDISSAELIDIERGYIDLAILEPPSGFDPQSQGAEFYQSSTWPPPRPQKGDSGFFIGYPGIYREPSERGLEIRSMPFNDFVSSVSDRHFIFVDEEGERRVYEYIKGLGKIESIGGVSGAAVYLLEKNGSLASSSTLVGFVYEANEGKNCTVFCNHADFIDKDGKIDRSKCL